MSKQKAMAFEYPAKRMATQFCYEMRDAGFVARTMPVRNGWVVLVTKAKKTIDKA